MKGILYDNKSKAHYALSYTIRVTPSALEADTGIRLTVKRKEDKTWQAIRRYRD